MNKVKQILQWYTEGVPKLTISLRAGVSRNNVKSYIRQFIAMDRSLEELLSLKDADLKKLFLSRPFKEPDQQYLELAACFPDIDKALKKKGNTLYRLWQEYLKEHPDGFKHTQFNKYYRQWSARTNSTMHIEHKAGDKMYVDYAGEKLQIVDPDTGEVHKVEVFVAILGASQLTWVEATMTQRKEDFIGACENALHYFGGRGRQDHLPNDLHQIKG